MIIITRQLGQSLRIGNETKLTITELHGKQVKIGIDAPREIKIYRKEIYDRIKAEKSDTKEVDENGPAKKQT